ncbi:MAG: 2-C-methyl-D-erythritol 4-phosphate cytidylyltransferase [Betaproteobacteria bacterium]|nr:2-C-methyl-D-erythritol 4-phosphate cytidylyltransferase [Betaproteobacteria bacterium]
MTANIIALVPAAGTGTRLGDSLPKQYLDLHGRPMIYHALAALAAVSRVSRIVVVLSPEDSNWPTFSEHWDRIGPKLYTLPAGGATRSETVANGLAAIEQNTNADGWVMVHDAARPCIRSELIEQFIDELEGDPIGGLLALPLSDTIKSGDENMRVEKTLSREDVWRAQTPQMFRYAVLREALAACPQATDESQAIEALGHRPKLVMGDSANLKVTYAPDLQLARLLLTLGHRE